MSSSAVDHSESSVPASTHKPSTSGAKQPTVEVTKPALAGDGEEEKGNGDDWDTDSDFPLDEQEEKPPAGKQTTADDNWDSDSSFNDPLDFDQSPKPAKDALITTPPRSMADDLPDQDVMDRQSEEEDEADGSPLRMESLEAKQPTEDGHELRDASQDRQSEGKDSAAVKMAESMGIDYDALGDLDSDLSNVPSQSQSSMSFAVDDELDPHLKSSPKSGQGAQMSDKPRQSVDLREPETAEVRLTFSWCFLMLAEK